MNNSRKSMRGFASMTSEQRKQIASMGGRAAHALGTAHRFSSTEASVAGRKGGLSRRRGEDAKATASVPSDDAAIEAVVPTVYSEELQPAI